MSEYEMQDLEYDNTDLGQTSGQFNLPAPRPIESLSALTTRIEAKQSYPKDDMRRLWVENHLKRKKLRDIDSKLEFLMLYKMVNLSNKLSDVAYPRELHNYHNDLPFMCSKMKINGVDKLVPNLYYKRKYVIQLKP